MPPKKRSVTAASAIPEKSHSPQRPSGGSPASKHAKTEGTPVRHSSGAPSPNNNGISSSKTPKKDGSVGAVEASAAAPRTSSSSGKPSKSAERKSKSCSQSAALPGASSAKKSASNSNDEQQQHKAIRPLKLSLADGHNDVNDDDDTNAAALSNSVSAPEFIPTNTVKDLESIVLRSKVIAPDVSGLSCVAANRAESEVVVARENGSLVLYTVEYFQNIPHFTQVRSTGGRVRRTITRLAFLDLSAYISNNTNHDINADRKDRYFVAAYLSGQIVVYDGETLFPVSVYQRTGGAVWDLAVATTAEGCVVYAALADGSWHRLRVVVPSSGNNSNKQQKPPTLELERIVPRIAGADRALSVAVSAKLRMAVGTDDAGNVHAWRHAAASAVNGDDQAGGSSNNASSSSAPTTLSSHETLWTCRLPKGMAMSCAIAEGSWTTTTTTAGASSSSSSTVLVRPAVAVGTSMGDVVILDAQHGHILHTFATHKGPVCTVIADSNVFYASGWHESLRAFRCSSSSGGGGAVVAEGEWYPAEVKRRTHYHEATQLLLLPQRRLLLSASRDATLMFAPVADIFSSPAMYVPVTTQRFALAQDKNVLLQTRLDRIEAFRMDAGRRHWAALFAHNIHGKFHLNGLWCDARLHFVVFATDERVVVSRIVWREGAEAALAIAKIEEVLELPAGRGLVDVLFVPRVNSSGDDDDDDNDEEEEQQQSGAGGLYLLFDDHILYVTLSEGYPVIRTDFVCTTSSGGEADSGSTTTTSIRPLRLVHCTGKKSSSSGVKKESVSAASLVAYGLRGAWRCELSADGTPDPDTARTTLGAAATYTHVETVPSLMAGGDNKDAEEAVVVVGLSAADGRYVKGITTTASAAGPNAKPASPSSVLLFPKTLPHDVTLLAELPHAHPKRRGGCNNDTEDPTTATATTATATPTATTSAAVGSGNFVGYFSKGLVFVGHREWRMAARMGVEAAFVMKDRRHILVLERNLEKTLEALPLAWKVRRFGN